MSITGDINAESGVSQVIYELAGPTHDFFRLNNYGGGLAGVGVILMCRDPHLNFKRRLRLDRKDKWLYLDIMLDFEQMKVLTHADRKQLIAKRIAEEVPVVIRKYEIPDFGELQFSADLSLCLVQIGALIVPQEQKN